MDKFTTLTAVAAPLPMQNIDTDKVIPARFLKTIKRTGLGVHLFDPLRYDAHGKERPDFILNQGPYRQAQILIAHENFGCGSSREHAPWALADFGIRCVIAPSFGDIFAQNAVKNGLLTAIVAESDAAELAATVAADPQREVTVDLERQTIGCGNRTYNFSIDPVSRNQLLNGWDDVDLTETFRVQISAYRHSDRRRRPWAVPHNS